MTPKPSSHPPRFTASEWKKKLRRRTECPFCGTRQKGRQQGEKCKNPECEAKVIKYGKELIWRHEGNFKKEPSRHR